MEIPVSGLVLQHKIRDKMFVFDMIFVKGTVWKISLVVINEYIRWKRDIVARGVRLYTLSEKLENMFNWSDIG